MADRYTGLRDMFDGGGRGQAGPRFEGGGILSAAANAVARPAGSRERGDADMRTGIGGFARDMVDGGGFGRTGPTFQGGMYGGLFGALLNAGGVRPMGYQERLGAVRPQMRPPMSAPAAYTPPAPTLAAQPNYADRFAVPPTLAAQPNYADRFAVPGSATRLPSLGLPPVPPAGTLPMEQWMNTTYPNGLPAGMTSERLADLYRSYAADLALTPYLTPSYD
jgi:hypothetical protein